MSVEPTTDVKNNTSKINLFKKLGQFNETSKETRIVNKDEFINEYKALAFSNGGDWCRQSSFMKEPNNYKFATATASGKINIMWNADDEEKETIEKLFKDNCTFESKGKFIKYFKIFGMKSSDGTRSIRKDILEYYKKQPCAQCGSTAELQCDHKNGLYNDSRVLHLDTQTLDDFQSLCRHCNCLKRQYEKASKATLTRYPATNIPSLKCYGIDFIEGDATLNLDNPNAMRGTYWYDPIAFHKYIQTMIERKIAELITANTANTANTTVSAIDNISAELSSLSVNE